MSKNQVNKNEVNTSFKEAHTFEKRKEESTKIREKYPDRIPIICEKKGNTDIPQLDKKKYLVPNDINISQFMYIIRKRIKLEPEKAIFLFINNKLPVSNTLISEIYKFNKDEDGFLYINYSGETTFG
jgi:GABA(A) receptor-associated protein